MSEKKPETTAEPAAVETPVEAVAPAPKKTEQTYALDSLARNCIKLFGVGSAAFAGATAELDADGKYTINEIEKTIKEWSKRGVK